MIKTQHCPNCEATEQKLSVFKQEVSDTVEKVIESCAVTSWGAAMLDPLIITKPKPDPLVGVAESMGYYDADAEDMAEEIRTALKAQGLEIREKG